MERRNFLRVGTLGGLSLAQFLRLQSARGDGPAKKDVNCIFIFLIGGMPQHDMWDPKPSAPLEFPSPFGYSRVEEFSKIRVDSIACAHKITDLPTKLEWHKKEKDLEKARKDKRKTLFDAQDKIEDDKDRLIAEIEAQLKQQTVEEEVFTIRWLVR